MMDCASAHDFSRLEGSACYSRHCNQTDGARRVGKMSIKVMVLALVGGAIAGCTTVEGEDALLSDEPSFQAGYGDGCEFLDQKSPRRLLVRQ